jgi:aspartyl protease family protein
MLWAMLLLLAAGAVAAILLGDQGTLGGIDGGMLAALVAAVALLIFIGAPLIGQYRGRLTKAAHDMLVWVALMLVLILAYSYRDEASQIYARVAGELMPPGHTLVVTEQGNGQQAVRIRRQPNGHYVARANVNGAVMTLLVDTGASTVVLKASDARAAGINVDRLSYSIPVRTANGLAYAASTQISKIAVGSIEMHNMDVLVAKPGVLNESLLGMNFLTRLRSYEFTGDFLTLRS